MNRIWQKVSTSFHERVKAACWDSLARQLLQLHQPHIFDGQLVCRGCDRQQYGTEASDPTWPCRTYTLIAGIVLNQPEVEETLIRMQRISSVAGHAELRSAGGVSHM